MIYNIKKARAKKFGSGARYKRKQKEKKVLLRGKEGLFSFLPGQMFGRLKINTSENTIDKIEYIFDIENQLLFCTLSGK